MKISNLFSNFYLNVSLIFLRYFLEIVLQKYRIFNFHYPFVDQIYPPARSWHCAEVEKDLFYRTALKIHKVTKVAPGRVCFDAVL